MLKHIAIIGERLGLVAAMIALSCSVIAAMGFSFILGVAILEVFGLDVFSVIVFSIIIMTPIILYIIAIMKGETDDQNL